MGRDKAAIPAAELDPDGTPPAELSLAERTARLLEDVCARSIEVGPGYSHLPSVVESPAGTGPLAAVAAGWEALAEAGWTGPVLVVATDLPCLTTGMLRWLSARPGRRSVVPVVDGRVQPLCARYSAPDMQRAVRLVAAGARAMRALIDSIDAEMAPPEEWFAAAGRMDVLADADTPDDLRRVTDQ